MTLALLLVLAQNPTLIDIRDLSAREHRVAGFVLAAPQELKITAVGAEAWPDRLQSRDKADWQDDEQTTWPAAAWILDARTRAVVWDLRAVDTRRESNGLRRFSGSVRLPAGVYEAHYASYAGASPSFNATDFNSTNLSDLVRLARRAKSGGPYVENGAYKEFALAIAGSGEPVSEERLDSARAVFRATSIVMLRPEPNATDRRGFELTRPTDVEVYSVGELRRDQAFDYGWIMNADTRKRVWTMTYDDTDPAGGAAKNRVAHETLRLKPGRYVAYFADDDTHRPGDWNNVPPTDPESWGLTLKVADPAARTAVKTFDYQPVPEGQTIVSFVEMGNDVRRTEGFTLKRAMDVRIYALGEASGKELVDYAWIADADKHARIWTMSFDNTEPAGGADKNRLFDGTVHLVPGSYLVYYRSDGSHSYDDWNAAPPPEARYWGVSIFPASGRLNPNDVAKFERGARPGGSIVAQLIDMGDDENARTAFQLTATTRLRVYALGEGRDAKMFDYGWIEDGSGRTVWLMKYDATEPAGGADKNRMFEGVITLPAGSYVLRYASDGSHSHADWNDEPPDDPDDWGITVFRIANR
ncbi:MAG TPA: hypothetical protein VGU74_13525 [Gemmatimonadales bacterium]|nr:hypothetical protein [Gemmatimonadales bacterium]